jgi:hypothetical protein
VPKNGINIFVKSMNKKKYKTFPELFEEIITTTLKILCHSKYRESVSVLNISTKLMRIHITET